MIVCHCEAVTDRDIRQSVAEGACSLRQVARACGGCLPVVEALLGQPTQRVVHRQPAAAPLAALG